MIDLSIVAFDAKCCTRCLVSIWIVSFDDEALQILLHSALYLCCLLVLLCRIGSALLLSSIVAPSL